MLAEKKIDIKKMLNIYFLFFWSSEVKLLVPKNTYVVIEKKHAQTEAENIRTIMKHYLGQHQVVNEHLLL